METYYQESSEELKPGEIKQAVKKVLESPEEVKAIVEKVKDIIDFGLELTLVGIIFTKILSFIFLIILFLWCHNKISGKWWKKRMIGWIWKRYIAVVILELMPFFVIIPANVILILMAHHKEKKVVKLFDLLLEELNKAGVTKGM